MLVIQDFLRRDLASRVDLNECPSLIKSYEDRGNLE